MKDGDELDFTSVPPRGEIMAYLHGQYGAYSEADFRKDIADASSTSICGDVVGAGAIATVAMARAAEFMSIRDIAGYVGQHGRELVFSCIDLGNQDNYRNEERLFDTVGTFINAMRYFHHFYPEDVRGDPSLIPVGRYLLWEKMEFGKLTTRMSYVLEAMMYFSLDAGFTDENSLASAVDKFGEIMSDGLEKDKCEKERKMARSMISEKGRAGALAVIAGRFSVILDMVNKGVLPCAASMSAWVTLNKVDLISMSGLRHFISESLMLVRGSSDPGTMECVMCVGCDQSKGQRLDVSADGESITVDPGESDAIARDISRRLGISSGELDDVLRDAEKFLSEVACDHEGRAEAGVQDGGENKAEEFTVEGSDDPVVMEIMDMIARATGTAPSSDYQG